MTTISNNPKYKLKDFILQDFIGSGAFGKVYRVKDKRSQQIYAAKISNTEVTNKNNYLHPKVSDFGLSKIDQAFSMNINPTKGTPKYIAPEIWDHNVYSKKIGRLCFFNGCL